MNFSFNPVITLSCHYSWKVSKITFLKDLQNIIKPHLLLFLTVDPPVWFDLLSENRQVVVAEHCSIKCVDPFPGVGSSM